MRELVRRARLDIRKTKPRLLRRPASQHYVILTASNGEPLLYGETHPTWSHAKKSRAAVIRAMIDVLQAEGYSIRFDRRRAEDG